MDTYFRAIGFSDFSNISLEDIKNEIIEKPERQYILEEPDGGLFYLESYKMYGEGIGIMVKASLTDYDDKLRAIPYVESQYNTNSLRYTASQNKGEIVILHREEKIDSDLMFFLQHEGICRENIEKFIEDGREDKLTKKKKVVNFSGISIDGTVILPLFKDEMYYEIVREDKDYVKELLSRIKKGDRLAKDLFLQHEEENNSLKRERIYDEGFLSIMDTYLIPNLGEDILYNVLGYIDDVSEIVNTFTNEKIYRLNIRVESLKFQIYINKEDLLGLPMKSMRFRGVCRLQGNVLSNYQKKKPDNYFRTTI